MAALGGDICHFVGSVDLFTCCINFCCVYLVTTKSGETLSVCSHKWSTIILLLYCCSVAGSLTTLSVEPRSWFVSSYCEFIFSSLEHKARMLAR